MARKIVIHKKHKIWLGILVGFVSAILVLALLVNSYWSPIFAKKVKSVVLTASDSLYNVDFSKAELHVLRGKIIIYNISLKPDTAVYNRRKKQHLAPNNLVALHVKRLVIDHFHPFDLYFDHKVEIGDIILNEPDVVVSYQLNHKTDTVVKDNRTVWQKMSKTLRSIHIGGIFLNDIRFKYSDYSGHNVAISELKEMSVSANDLLIDSATQKDKSRLLFCKDIVAELNNYKGQTHSGLYTYTVKHLKLSTHTSQLNMEGITLEATDKANFFSKTKKDRFTLNLDSLQLNNFDYLSYHKYRKVSASMLIFKHGSFSLFNNPNKSNKTKVDKINSFPAEVLSKLSTDLKLDTVLVKHVDINYSEYNKKSYQTGTIKFDNTNGRLLNITNNKAALAKNSICTVRVSSRFMNSANLNVSFTFNLSDKNMAYSYKGDLGPMNLAAINPAVIPFAMVKITSGTIKQLSFDIHADSHTNKGKVSLLYNNLKVKLLKPDTNYNGLSGKFIESMYANLFIIKHDNPDKDGEAPRTFNVIYLRPINSPFFKTIWHTLLSGIKPSIGLDEKTEQATQAKMNDQTSKKQERLTKKAARQQRRAARKLKRELKKEQKKDNS
jgi:hypothetical protein